MRCKTLLGMVFLVAGTAMADTVIYNNPAIAGNQSWGGSLGMDFNVTAPISINTLGAFDSGQDGFNNGSITVQLFDRNATGSPLATVVLTGTNGTLIGGSRFLSITPLVLNAGFQGTIVAFGYNSLEQNGNTHGGSGVSTLNNLGGRISFVGGSRYANDTLYPTTIDGGPENRYLAGTFSASAVPEPVELSLFAVAGLSIAALRSRRKQ